MCRFNGLLNFQMLLTIFILRLLTDGVMFDYLNKLKTVKLVIFMIGNS